MKLSTLLKSKRESAKNVKVTRGSSIQPRPIASYTPYTGKRGLFQLPKKPLRSVIR